MILRWAIPSAAGAVKARKSDGVIHDGTARTAKTSPLLLSSQTKASESIFAFSRKTCTVPWGSCAVPEVGGVNGTNLAVAASDYIIVES